MSACLVQPAVLAVQTRGRAQPAERVSDAPEHVSSLIPREAYALAKYKVLLTC